MSSATSRVISKSAAKLSLLLPKPRFPMRSRAAVREPVATDRITTHAYRKQLERRKGKSADFVLHDGPPYANGNLHLGHFVNRVVKDTFNRFHTLRGRRAVFVPGWDCHGLPIELKALKLQSSGARTPAEVRNVAEACAKDAIKAQMADMVRWGAMADWEACAGADAIQASYRTLDPAYEAEQLRMFAHLARSGCLKRGEQPVYWSPATQTALAEAELEYADDHASRSIYVGFKLHVTRSPPAQASTRA